jgi:hypothetical protein
MAHARYMVEVDIDLLNLLKNHHSLTTSEIIKQLPYRESNVRQHLKILCEKHKIMKVPCSRVDLRCIHYALVKHDTNSHAD